MMAMATAGTQEQHGQHVLSNTVPASGYRQTALPEASLRVVQEQVFDGDHRIAERDAYKPELGQLRNSEREVLTFNDNPYTVWKNAGNKFGFRPVVFEPTGSFQALRDAGKLTELSHPRGRAIGGRAGDHVQQKKYYMPGYTGYTRGSRHIAGRTYGETTRRALDTDYRELVCTSPIPSAPQGNRKIKHESVPDSFVSKTFGGKEYHVPGYTGHCPGLRQTYATTYGASTSHELYKEALRHPRIKSKERDGYASSMKPRQMLVIDSAPLPGPRVHSAPEKLIPAHLRYVRFFPQ